MPFLRFSRDKRGYENTYLCHTFQKDGTSKLKVLYWFRSPPNVGIGRVALDPEAVRIIEQSNPGLTFDWEEILKAQPPQVGQEKGSSRGSQRALTGRSRSGVVKEPRQSRTGVESTRPDAELNDPQGSPNGHESSGVKEPRQSRTGVESTRPDAELNDPQGSPNDHESSRVTGGDGGLGARPAQHVALEIASERELNRLRSEYVALKARSEAKKNEKEADGLVGRIEQLIEQLNPDAWISVDEAQERIAAFDESLATLRKAFGRPRRARRGGRNRRKRDTSSEEVGVQTAARGKEPPKVGEGKETGQD